jgi:hypothetical protein
LHTTPSAAAAIAARKRGSLLPVNVVLAAGTASYSRTSSGAISFDALGNGGASSFLT